MGVNRGEILAIVGPSGCGKSTLLSCVAGLVKPELGDIKIDNDLVFSKQKRQFMLPEERQVGMVFQNYALWPHKTVYDNIAYPLKIRKLRKKDIKIEVAGMLEKIRLEGKENSYPHELSGGEQQRVALARALVMKPKVLLLDEPLSSLDAKLREKIQDEIKELQRDTGITIIHVTHDQREAMGMADRIAVMRDGQLIQLGTPKEIYENPKTEFVANFVGKTNIVTGIVEVDKDKKKIVFLGKDIARDIDIDMNIGQRILLSIRPENIALSKEFGILKGIVKGVNFRGNIIEYNILIDSKKLIAQTNAHTIYKRGDMVGVTFNKVNIVK